VIRKENESRIGRKMNPVTNGMKGGVVNQKRSVEGYMFAITAEKEDTKGKIVERPDIELEHPKYMQRSVCTRMMEDSSWISPTVVCTMTDDLLPRPPPEEYMNQAAVSTIKNNPHLFRIVTPINVDCFEELLKTHLNKLFVQSICISLHEGFWPWATTQKEEYPTTWDFSERPPKTEHRAGFLREQRDIELAERRYSEVFGTNLLPGMYSTPIHAVPKPHSEKFEACQ
jgi:hypothetical protein